MVEVVKELEKFDKDAYLHALSEDKEIYLMIVGPEMNDLFEYRGIIGEVISRKPKSCDMQELGTLEKITMNQESFGGDISTVKTYIFKINRVDTEENITLVGTANEYNLNENVVGEEDFPLELTIKEMPKYKEKMCVGTIDGDEFLSDELKLIKENVKILEKRCD